MDTLRTIATLLEILIHVFGDYVVLGMGNNTFDLSFRIGNITDLYSRICVPIFFLDSGMFLIVEKETFAQSYFRLP